MGELVKLAERSRRSKIAGALLLAGAALAACSPSRGYGSSVEACEEGDNTGIVATPGDGSVNDPLVVLKFAIEANTGINDNWIDKSGENGNFWTSGDGVDQLGEVVCSTGSSAEQNPSSSTPSKLVFTPSGAEARTAYIASNPPRG